ncbi:polysaccharide deacetylase family protein [Saccharopolyspora mangrovi]|uniref:polysaccharide deacetylase family protein n=1 Tax=Saccharopolyspora mangrovi TaxID=3082379 RepID=UPI002B4BF438|nr:polysaccharide deacetylase [Saccharopolyspora sp. S2-29]
MSRGEFCAYAIARILRLLDRHGIITTFFVPGHTLETYPEQCAAIHEAGHEIGLHGYLHESVSSLDRDTERSVLHRSADLIEKLTGTRPLGHRTPSFDFSPHTVELLEELAIEYDSSLMGTDHEPYYARVGDQHQDDGPYLWGRRSSVVEVPASWTLDDYVHLEYVRFNGMVMPGLQDPRSMFARFLDEVRYMAEHIEDGVTNITLHPQVIGRGGRMLALEEFIDRCQGFGVEFRTCLHVSRAFRARALAATG